MKITDLEKLGLTEKQAKIYLACLEIGHGSAQAIAEKTGLPKSTTYDTLKSLVASSLLSIYVKKSRKRFTPTAPSTLQERIKQQTEVMSKILPELEALYTSSSISKPNVRFFEGKNGFKVVKNEIFKEAKEIVGITAAHELFAKFSEYFPEFPKERAKLKIPIRLIMPDSPRARERKATGPQELRQVKIVPSKFPFHALIWSWRNKLSVITTGEDVIILIIESKDLALTFRTIFELLWQRLD